MRYTFSFAFFAVLATAAESTADRPNIILIITDDQGYGDLSCHGNPVLKTPNMDALHADSVRLVDYHVSPTCSPTRSALLTGHWTNRTGVWHTILGRSILRDDEVTLAEILNTAGYATGMFGKWHLGDNYPSRPEDRGFAEVMRHGGGGVGQTPDYWDNAYFDGSYFHNSRPEPVNGFCTDVWFDYARRFIKQQSDQGKPFFAYIATNAPHGPMHAPESYSKPYQQLPVNTANFFGMIANIDANLGRLREFLQAEGLQENTVLIFTTDNGTAAGGRVFNHGMRGFKGSEYDGGHRVPFFVHWPAGNFTGGRDVVDLAAHVDVVPTLLDLCDVKAPENVKFDGRSIRALLEGKASRADGSWPDRLLITDSQRVRDPIKWRKSAVMSHRWRLINGEDLYDIKADPGQKNNVAKDHAEVVNRMRSFYESWWAELKPTFKKDCTIYVGHPQENPAVLTCHDWITDGITPWNQASIRNGQHGKRSTGFWNVKVVEDGDYEIRLRRWPKEAAAAVDAPLPAGEDVPGAPAYRARPGKAIGVVKATVSVGHVQEEATVESGALEVVFTLPLKKGDAKMAARFYTRTGEEYGAYYAYVRKL